jgi:hypothetical protein
MQLPMTFLSGKDFTQATSRTHSPVLCQSCASRNKQHDEQGDTKVGALPNKEMKLTTPGQNRAWQLISSVSRTGFDESSGFGRLVTQCMCVLRTRGLSSCGREAVGHAGVVGHRAASHLLG